MKKLLVTCAFLAIPSLAFANTPKEETIDKLNSLLRGEISAVETYRQALEKVSNEPGANTVRELRDNHKAAVDDLKAEVARLGGTPSTDSGAWGAWAKTVEGTAKLFGDTAALKALKEGEEHGLDEYKEAVADKDIAQNVKEKINSKYIPQQQKHIKEIDSLMNMQQKG